MIREYLAIKYFKFPPDVYHAFFFYYSVFLLHFLRRSLLLRCSFTTRLSSGYTTSGDTRLKYPVITECCTVFFLFSLLHIILFGLFRPNENCLAVSQCDDYYIVLRFSIKFYIMFVKKRRTYAYSLIYIYTSTKFKSCIFLRRRKMTRRLISCEICAIYMTQKYRLCVVCNYNNNIWFSTY